MGYKLLVITKMQNLLNTFNLKLVLKYSLPYKSILSSVRQRVVCNKIRWTRQLDKGPNFY